MLDLADQERWHCPAAHHAVELHVGHDFWNKEKGKSSGLLFLAPKIVRAIKNVQLFLEALEKPFVQPKLDSVVRGGPIGPGGSKVRALGPGAPKDFGIGGFLQNDLALSLEVFAPPR